MSKHTYIVINIYSHTASVPDTLSDTPPDVSTWSIHGSPLNVERHPARRSALEASGFRSPAAPASSDESGLS